MASDDRDRAVAQYVAAARKADRTYETYERQRDERDLALLDALEAGATQSELARASGKSRQAIAQRLKRLQ